MRITFTIDYHTQWGESLWIETEHDVIATTPLMPVQGSDRWQVVADIPDSIDTLSYRYTVRCDSNVVRAEWGDWPHRLNLATNASHMTVDDHWAEIGYDNPFLSSAFTKCIFRRNEPALPQLPKAGMVTLEVEAPTVVPGSTVGVCGSCDLLGNWDVGKAVIMSDADFPRWRVNLPIDALQKSIDFKFVVIDKPGSNYTWEEGKNRTLILPAELASGQSHVVAGLRLRTTSRLWHGAGVAIPVFSLRSDSDFGVGDFIDLKLMVDWAVATGMKFIQILPINDTTMTGTWLDSYPYNANSTFALHPMYLRVEEIGTIQNSKNRKRFEALKRELNALPQVDYERVNNAKRQYTREIFNQSDGQATLRSADFLEFVTRNHQWLEPYAAFCCLRDIYETPQMDCWGEFAEYSEEKLQHVINTYPDEINFVYFQQYHLDRQLRQVCHYARQAGVALKGDIPIGISRTSVDAWTAPRLFNLDSQAGAPPDDFSVFGQNWGFPTYNWEEMAHDGFAWWKARFSKMAEYFDAYRIDHVLGFFRIWQIPMNAIHGLLGIFNPALPFSPDELAHNYGFNIDADLHTQPYIVETMLEEIFGSYAKECRSTYLEPMADGRYKLRQAFDTQRKVTEHFTSFPKSEKNLHICNALLGLIDQVLFIEDPKEKGKYHPRITAHNTSTYRLALSDHQRWCFDGLYNDFFYHRHNDFWREKAMEKLPPLIEATQMLVCVEDLGMIPACVPTVMNRLEMLSLEIQRMPKDPNTPFGVTQTYPYHSVCTTSTHDMDGIRRWWETNGADTQRFYNQVLGLPGKAPVTAEPWICDKIIGLHLESPSMLCILPLQDWLSIDGTLRRTDPSDELINIPANPRHYWRYRMHLALESLNSQSQFNTHLHQKITNSGR